MFFQEGVPDLDGNHLAHALYLVFVSKYFCIYIFISISICIACVACFLSLSGTVISHLMLCKSPKHNCKVFITKRSEHRHRIFKYIRSELTSTKCSVCFGGWREMGVIGGEVGSKVPAGKDPLSSLRKSSKI